MSGSLQYDFVPGKIYKTTNKMNFYQCDNQGQKFGEMISISTNELCLCLYIEVPYHSHESRSELTKVRFLYKNMIIGRDIVSYKSLISWFEPL